MLSTCLSIYPSRKIFTQTQVHRVWPIFVTHGRSFQLVDQLHSLWGVLYIKRSRMTQKHSQMQPNVRYSIKPICKCIIQQINKNGRPFGELREGHITSTTLCSYSTGSRIGIRGIYKLLLLLLILCAHFCDCP